MTALYDDLGRGYASRRRPDPRIATRIRAALGPSVPVLDVGAGAGSYEPTDLAVVAVEPSRVMLAQRAGGAPPAVCAVAEALPFPDGAFAAAMAILTVHHWPDIDRGLAELRRVVTGPIAVLSWDASVADDYWMVAEYLPGSRALDRRLPSPHQIGDRLGGATVEVLEVPADCTDGFYAAWWRRPRAYLDPAVRAAISGIARLPASEVDAAVRRLERDLDTGAWARRHADLLGLDAYDAGYRLIVTG